MVVLGEMLLRPAFQLLHRDTVRAEDRLAGGIHADGEGIVFVDVKPDVTN